MSWRMWGGRPRPPAFELGLIPDVGLEFGIEIWLYTRSERGHSLWFKNQRQLKRRRDKSVRPTLLSLRYEILPES
jgi:hypothetical protein